MVEIAVANIANDGYDACVMPIGLLTPCQYWRQR